MAGDLHSQNFATLLFGEIQAAAHAPPGILRGSHKTAVSEAAETPPPQQFECFVGPAYLARVAMRRVATQPVQMNLHY